MAAADMCVHAGAHARNHGKRRAFTRETASLRKPTVLSRDGLRRALGKGKSSVSIFFSCRITRRRLERHAAIGREERHAGMWTVEIHIYLAQYIDVILQCCTPESRRYAWSARIENVLCYFPHLCREKKVITQLARRNYNLNICICAESNEPSIKCLKKKSILFQTFQFSQNHLQWINYLQIIHNYIRHEIVAYNQNLSFGYSE